jgi:hypothetical protein
MLVTDLLQEKLGQLPTTNPVRIKYFKKLFAKPNKLYTFATLNEPIL